MRIRIGPCKKFQKNFKKQGDYAKNVNMGANEYNTFKFSDILGYMGQLK
jgi:hypothetical protein